jgi:predicted DNA-binding transcriptional regulator YafY
MKSDSAKKALRRDMGTLRSFGVVINKEQRDGQSWWSVSDDTWADPDALSEHDAILLDLRCRSLLNDPTFEYRDELATACARLRGRQALVIQAAEGMRGHAASSTTGMLLEACANSLECKVTYQKANGEVDNRTIQPLASFVLREHTYFVASISGSEEEPHNYRDDRFSAVKVTSTHFERPEGFDVDKFIRLPFQMGDPKGRVTFRTSTYAREPLNQLLANRAELSDDGTTATVEYSNAREAASWAVAYGLVPTDDQEVIKAWKDIVERSAS